MEVIIPSRPTMEIDFGSSQSAPYVLSAPSTPKRFGEYYFSAPSSPSRMADFYREFDEFSMSRKGREASSSSVPFSWEEKPGKPKSPKGGKDEQDFEFNFSQDMERASLSAEELFDGGKIRPLKPPSRLQLPDKYKSSSTEVAGRQSPVLSPRSSLWQGKRVITEALTLRRKSKEVDPSKAAMENAKKRKPDQERGRDRASAYSSGTRAARSLSPYRVSSYPWEDEEKEKQQLQKLNNSSKQSSSSLFNPSPSSSKGSGSGSKKWRLKDFLLFRSASEGRATDNDPFRKYAAIFKRQEDIRNSSFRSTTDSPAGSISRRRSGPVSAHELHYTVNKAVSDDLKKRTFLPYKQGILGRLAFNPAVHALANGFGSLYR
ncbi:uncharacterized protein LOC116212851 [Punica granatum]|uniref:Uncharacterized protein LOC116212851 n=2 Tax=Punica granatum TaxID=22663 RepID=A0A6P8EDL2_PUNGR|nr:uncharacterized protein LOC116212851 [Punica granatum]PKI46110.1 hypothetical protein CRG98_033505 [Punica granatum]